MEQNKALSDLTTFGIGGPASFFFKAETIEEMKEAILFANAEKLPFLVLGKGSNTLFDDQGFQGVVIQNKIDFFLNPEPGFYHVGSGFSFALLGTRTAQKGYSGLEFASGIPASVGGAIFMNAGANGHETADTLISVEFMDENGLIHRLNREDLEFSYRTSPFQKYTGAIVSATFRLESSLTARQKQLEIIGYRTKTQPYGEKSAGCVFRNPKNFSAGQLIELAELKGQKIGGAKVSETHANFIVNDKNASSKDILDLIEFVKTKVHQTHQIELESEIRIIPYKL